MQRPANLLVYGGIWEPSMASLQSMADLDKIFGAQGQHFRCAGVQCSILPNSGLRMPAVVF